MFDAYVERIQHFVLNFLITGFFKFVGGTSKKEEVKRLPGGKVKKKVSYVVYNLPSS